MHTPLLSICIPTYNRAEDLNNCLASIASQVTENPSLNDQLEVVISDNASTDHTQQIVDDYRATFSNLTYVRNDENMGFDKNTLRAVRAASGTYAWYLGDDDMIVHGALSFVVTLLQSGRYDVGGFASEPLAAPTQYQTPTMYTLKDVVSERDANTYYFNGYCQGGLSVLLFNRAQWLEAVDEHSYIEHWLYYETVLKVLGRSTRESFFVTKITIVTGQDCRWAENGDELFTYINSNILLQKMQSWNFDPTRIDAELYHNAKKLPLIMLRAKGHGLPFRLQYLAYVWRHMAYTGLPRLLLASIFFFIPNPLVRLARAVRKGS